jgi:hypothetical protein
VIEWVNQLITDAPQLLRYSLKCCYELINNDITGRMLASEQKVKTKQFKYEWSVELDQAGYCICYWQTCYSNTKNNSTSHMALSHLFKRAGLKEGEVDVCTMGGW